MVLKHYTDKNAIQLLSTQSRRMDITPFQLCQIHFELGKYLAYEIAEEFNLEEYDIQHPQGIRKGKKLNEDEISILSIIRAGNYASEGIRYVFQNSAYYQTFANIDNIPSLKNKSIIIVDSVINTGNTIRPLLNKLLSQNVKKVIVACLVIPKKTAIEIEHEYPDVHFYAARVSENSYVGTGKSDTGNRLFGTYKK